jgi:KaiC/GvpD/RAD55 family RecA-like ATPase
VNTHGELEAATLGALLRLANIDDREQAAKVFEILTAADFTGSGRRLVFETLRDLIVSGRPADLSLVKAELIRRGTLKTAGGDKAIIELAEAAEVPGHAVEYARNLKRASLERQAGALVERVRLRLESHEPCGAELESLRVVLAVLEDNGEAEGPKPIPAPELIATASEEIDFAIEPLMSMGALTQLQGKPKGGKSCFALLLALAIAAGVPVGRFTVRKARRVLFVSFEDSPRRLKRRILQYMGGLNVPVPDGLLVWDAPTIDLPRDERVVLRVLKGCGAEVLVIDTLSYVHSAEENRADAMRPVMASIRRIARNGNVGILLIHHTRKSSHAGDVGGPSDKGRGSSAIVAAADCIVDWGDRVAPGRTAVKVVSKDGADFEFCAVYSEGDGEADSVSWEIADPLEREDVAALKRRVLDAVVKLASLHPDGVTRGDVARLGIASAPTVGNYLIALAKEGALEVSDGQRGAKLYRPADGGDRKASPAFGSFPVSGQAPPVPGTVRTHRKESPPILRGLSGFRSGGSAFSVQPKSQEAALFGSSAEGGPV